MRPMMLEFQEDARLAEVYNQMLLGDRLMLCPVMEAGAVTRRVILPAGRWYDWWTDQSWEGPGEVEVPAPLDTMPVLVRGGTLLPLGPALQCIPDGHTFDHLEFHLWPPYPARFDLYDDDGASRAYKLGDYTVTHISADSIHPLLLIRLSPAIRQGKLLMEETNDLIPPRQAAFVLHRSPPPQTVRLNGHLVSGWKHDAAAGCTHIQVSYPTNQETEIEVLLTP
jgi:hypothetical protein